jgi:hypothetical protein
MPGLWRYLSRLKERQTRSSPQPNRRHSRTPDVWLNHAVVLQMDGARDAILAPTANFRRKGYASVGAATCRVALGWPTSTTTSRQSSLRCSECAEQEFAAEAQPPPAGARQFSRRPRSPERPGTQAASSGGSALRRPTSARSSWRKRAQSARSSSETNSPRGSASDGGEPASSLGPELTHHLGCGNCGKPGYRTADAPRFAAQAASVQRL